MTLEVIGAGFGRTGTASMKAALEILGYDKTHHMFEVMTSKDQLRLWHDVATGKPPQWEQIFDGFPAAVDFPSASYWRELAAHYPQAKVILTTRSSASWWKSARATIIEIGRTAPRWATRFIPPVRMNKEMVDGTVWNRMFDGRQFEEEHARAVFDAHNEAVQAELPPERLLVFEVKQGWEPLCAFLGKPVPDRPFPHVNDSAQFQSLIRRIKWGFGAIHALAILALAGGAWALLN
ncbi:MAG: sulfotransferase family protein [Erythrobacter sp.]